MLRLLVLLILIWPRAVADSSIQFEIERLVIWNVGQGLWVTWVTPHSCWHFDMGGEFAPWSRISKVCRNRNNVARFSHWDWDHINFAKRAHRSLNDFCVLTRPGGIATASKSRFFSHLPQCLKTDGDISQTREIYTAARSQAHSTNRMSRVFLLKKLALLPGDSGTREERIWSSNLVSEPIRLLVLGHHGSRTSTSAALLNRMPALKMAVASARRARYGHPHKHVANRLKKRGVALIRTEDWGTLHWEVPRSDFY